MFDKSTRTLMAMLFQRNAVDEISGKLEDGRGWSVNCRRPSQYCSETCCDGYIAGCYDDFRADTLDETLDMMNAYLAAEAGMAALLKEAAV